MCVQVHALALNSAPWPRLEMRVGWHASHTGTLENTCHKYVIPESIVAISAQCGPHAFDRGRICECVHAHRCAHVYLCMCMTHMCMSGLQLCGAHSRPLGAGRSRPRRPPSQATAICLLHEALLDVAFCGLATHTKPDTWAHMHIARAKHVHTCTHAMYTHTHTSAHACVRANEHAHEHSHMYTRIKRTIIHRRMC